MSEITRNAGEKTVYTTCQCNCGATSHCVLKAHVKDGVITAVEPDDRYNPGVGREDAAMSEQDLIKNRLQRRPCVKGLAFYKYYLQAGPDLYPSERAPRNQEGRGQICPGYPGTKPWIPSPAR